MPFLRTVLTAFCAIAAIPSLSAQEAITLPGRDGLTIKAKLYRPAGSGPWPAIVALHGCGGPWQPRDDDWGNRLAGAGFLVVFPDSFGSRGLGSQWMIRARSIRPRDRAEDAFATAEWLATRVEVRRNGIGLLGWSHGGSTVLSAARTGRKPKGVEFRQAIAFYPGCRAYAEEGNYRARLPVTILHGLADNWTPAEPCRALPGTRFRGFENAHHNFDHPNLPLRQRKAAYTADGSGVVTVGTHPEARAAAILQVMAIFGGM